MRRLRQSSLLAFTSLVLWGKLFYGNKLQWMPELAILIWTIFRMVNSLQYFFIISAILCLGLGTTKFVMQNSEQKIGYIETVLNEFWFSIEEDTGDKEAEIFSLHMVLRFIFAIFVLLILMVNTKLLLNPTFSMGSHVT